MTANSLRGFLWLFILSLLLMTWGINYRQTLNFKQSMFLSGYLLLIAPLVAFLSPWPIVLLLLGYSIIKTFWISQNFATWLIPVISILWNYSVITLIWLASIDLPQLFLSYEYSDSLQNLLKLAAVQISWSLFFSLLSRCLFKRFNVAPLLLSINKKHRYFSASILIFYTGLIILHRMTLTTANVLSSILSFILLLISGLLFVSIFYWIAKSYEERQLQQTLAETATELRQKYEGTAEFRHDYRDILLSLKGYLDAAEIVDARTYLDQVLVHSKVVLQQSYYIQIQRLPILPLQTLLSSFVAKAQEADCPLELEIAHNIYSIEMDLVDLVRCISILLNNAWEAVQETEDKRLNVSISQSKDTVTFQIKNTFAAKPSLTEIIKKHYTTKVDHHGHGLATLNRLVKQYNNVDFSLELQGTIFSARLTIEKNHRSVKKDKP